MVVVLFACGWFTVDVWSAVVRSREIRMPSPPPYTKTEIERRWLVQTAAELERAAAREREIDDRYILETRLRLRKVTEAGQAPIYKLGKKYEPHAPGAHHTVSAYLPPKGVGREVTNDPLFTGFALATQGHS